MSFFKRVRKAVSRVTHAAVKVTEKPFTKKGIRSQLGVLTKVGKVAIPVVSAAVTYFAGPVVGEAFAYGGTRLQQQTSRASLRGKGLSSHVINQKSRAIANRTFKYSQYGIGAGGLVSGAVAAASGTGSLSTVLGSTGSLLGKALPSILPQAHPSIVEPAPVIDLEPGAAPGFGPSGLYAGAGQDLGQAEGPSGPGAGELLLLLGLGLAVAA